MRHSLAHWTRRRGMTIRMTRGHILRNIGVAPAPDAVLRIRGNVVGAPALQLRTGEFLPMLQPKTQIARRVAFGAMSQRRR